MIHVIEINCINVIEYMWECLYECIYVYVCVNSCVRAFDEYSQLKIKNKLKFKLMQQSIVIFETN